MAGNKKTPPRLHRVGLRRGTRYQVEENNMLSPPRVVEQDVEVFLRDLADVFNVYETLDGKTIFVRVCDEIHDEMFTDPEDES